MSPPFLFASPHYHIDIHLLDIQIQIGLFSIHQFLSLTQLH